MQALSQLSYGPEPIGRGRLPIRVCGLISRSDLNFKDDCQAIRRSGLRHCLSLNFFVALARGAANDIGHVAAFFLFFFEEGFISVSHFGIDALDVR
jgi:hypothetical protein